MIDFKNGVSVFSKLKVVSNKTYEAFVIPLFTENESILETFKGIRDGVVFTNKRIISINVQGLTGTKKDFTSLPYSKIQAFSVETAGILDFDSELDLWFSGIGRVRFEFSKDSDIATICKIISERTL